MTSKATRTLNCDGCHSSRRDTETQVNEVRYVADISTGRRHTAHWCDTHLADFIALMKESLAGYQSTLPKRDGVPGGVSLTTAIRIVLSEADDDGPGAVSTRLKAYLSLYREELQEDLRAMTNTVSILGQLEQQPARVEKVMMRTLASTGDQCRDFHASTVDAAV